MSLAVFLDQLDYGPIPSAPVLDSKEKRLCSVSVRDSAEVNKEDLRQDGTWHLGMSRMEKNCRDGHRLPVPENRC